AGRDVQVRAVRAGVELPVEDVAVERLRAVEVLGVEVVPHEPMLVHVRSLHLRRRQNPGELTRVSGAPPRTVPRLVSVTRSSAFAAPPLLVTASASVLMPRGSRMPLGTTNVCCGPTSPMYWPMFQPLTKISTRYAPPDARTAGSPIVIPSDASWPAG